MDDRAIAKVSEHDPEDTSGLITALGTIPLGWQLKKIEREKGWGDEPDYWRGLLEHAQVWATGYGPTMALAVMAAIGNVDALPP